MKKFKYVIVTPSCDNGGCLVLHALCKYLTDLGECARVFYFDNYKYDESKRLQFWIHWLLYQIKVTIKQIVVFFLGEKSKRFFIHVPKCKYRRKILPFVDDNTVVVYNEKVFGNPLHAKNIVRWLLLYNAYYKQEGDKRIGYDKNDLFFAYREVFNDYTLNPEKRLLSVSYFDLDLYKRTNYGDRSGKCYILRKGAWRSDVPKNIDGIVIDDLPEKEKVEVFNKCEYCISYDTQTSYSQIAAMCGCISIVVPEEGKCKEDYRSNYDNDYGEAFGFSKEEINYAKKTAPYIIENYKSINEKSIENVRNFIYYVNKYFHKDK